MTGAWTIAPLEVDLVARLATELEQPELAFKREYLSRLGEEIGFKFYPSYNGDRIPWAS